MSLKNNLKVGLLKKLHHLTPINPESKLHYIPHHGVKKDSFYNSNKDSIWLFSWKINLNNCLLSGLPMVADLGKLLLNFRLKPYAISSDIEKDFLRVGLGSFQAEECPDC